MPRVSTGSIRCLRQSRCVETLFAGGDLAWRNDGSFLYTMRGDVVKGVRVDDPLQSMTIGSEEEGLKLTSITLDDSNTRLTVAFTNGLMRELDVSGVIPREVRSWRSLHSAPILVMTYSPLSNLLATGSSDFNVLIWDMDSHRLVAKLSGPSVVSSLVFITSSLTTGYIVISSRDHTATVVDPKSGVKKNTVLLFEACESAVIVPDSRLITVGEEGKIKEWNIEKSKLIKSQTVANEGLEGVWYNSVRHELMVATATKNIVFLDAETLTVKREIVGMHDEIFSVEFMGDKDDFLAVASNSPELKLYETKTFNCKFIPGHTASVVSLSVPHWNSSLLASCAKDNSVIIWKLNGEKETLSPLAVCSGHTSTPSSISFSHTCTVPFLLSIGYDTMLKLWPLNTLPTKTFDSVEKAVHLSCSSTLKAHAKDSTCVDVSPTDAVVVTGGMDKMAKLWAVDTTTMQLGIVGNLSGHRRGIWDARFSSQGEKVATSSGDAIVRVFSVHDRSMLATLEGHTSAVLKILFVNNGNQLMSADSGGILRVWDVKGGVEDVIWSVCTSKKEELYVTAGSDGRILVWEDATELLQKEEMERQMKHQKEVQTLDNLMADERYKDALKYALGLDRPHCALKVVIFLTEKGELGEAILDLEKNELLVLLQFTVKWNTNTKNSHAAQMVLQSILLQTAPESLLEIPGIGGILAELLPYTKRHYDRLNKSRQDVSLLNFYWKQMRVAN
ncbi:hypothetical protein PRIPAC_87335 [Pristionchus pacificus]|uniref:WD40 domain-containing protein n=1 Tax=Pristionchus pacificus TaxID=54126 RepID=A0A2A6CIK4_PRIPA|nr:hypothetical protein PRIPAC_87335 [Pristionchus pacificus]|eukprot:PDM78064.1 WD40 domain-containing protein [Pristionchus pacificus]